jgi:hypothetical protein
MDLVLISKYARVGSEKQPTRHFFFAKELAKRGHNITLIKSRSSFVSEHSKLDFFFEIHYEDNIKVITLNGPIIKRGFSLIRIFTWFQFEYYLFKYLKNCKSNFDVILVSSLSIFTFITGVWYKRRILKPLIIEVRDIYPLTLVEIGKFKRYNPLVIILNLIEKYGYSNADYIVSSLENLNKHIETRIKKNFKFEWIPTGADVSLYNQLDVIKFDLKYYNQISAIKSKGFFIIGYAGTIGKANSLEIIFNLAEKFQNNQKKVYFLFIGEGPMLEYYSLKYKHLENVMFNKFVSKNILSNYLSQCDILINSWSDSVLYEFGISPNKWNEYMFSERPFLLLYNYESKIFNEANCGWQVGTIDKDLIYNKILEIKLLSNEELKDIGMNGKNYLLNSLSYDQLTDKFEKIFEDVKINKIT